MIFKKRSSSNTPLDKLTIGTTLQCNTLQWEIVEISRYDWSTDGRSLEYKLASENNEYEAYLEVERTSKGYEIFFYEDIDIDGIELLQATKIGAVDYLSEHFKLNEQYKGSCKNETLRTEWTPVESYIFYNKNDTMLCIEKTEEHGCNAYYGFELAEDDITKIKLP